MRLTTSLGNVAGVPTGVILHRGQLTPALGKATWLSPQEQQASDAMDGTRRHEFRASRALMRQLLAALLGCNAAEAPLEASPGERPRLRKTSWRISLSHSRGMALVGLARQPIGVDLEWAGRSVNLAVARRWFGAAEAQRLMAQPTAEAARAFLHSWAAREAAGKARGTGIRPFLQAWNHQPAHQTLITPSGDSLQVRCGEDQDWVWACCCLGKPPRWKPRATVAASL